MKKYFSASKNGFFDDSIHDSLPPDAKEISDELHAQLLIDQSAGKLIIANQAAMPEAVDRASLLSLDEMRAARIVSLGFDYRIAIQQPVSYMSTTFQADDASQQTLTRCLVAGSVPAGFYWMDSTNAKINMTFAQLQGLAAAMLAQGQAAFDRLQTRKASINAATDVASVQAVVW